MKLKTKFQDEDFELGEVVTADIATMPDGRIKLQAAAKKGGLHTIFYDTLEKLNEEWEDYEEPKKYWGIDYSSCRIGGIEEFSYDNDKIDEFNKAIGNFFETKEEAEKAVEKLKAWKRLKDKGFKFVQYYNDDEYCKYKPAEEYEGMYDDLDLLFGGKE